MQSTIGWAVRRSAALALLPAISACGPERPGPGRPTPAGDVEGALPAIPFRDGPLVLDVVYPEEGGALAVRDSTFVFGSTGTGEAVLTINGEPVPVAPNGAFLAFLPVPEDGVYRFAARTADEATELIRTVVLPPPPPTLSLDTVAILEQTIFPRGGWVAAPGERIEVGFRGSPGGRAALVLPGGTRVPLVEAAAAPEEEPGAAFIREPDTAPAPERTLISEYRGFFEAVALATQDTAVATPTLVPLAARGPVEADSVPEPAAAAAVLELVIGNDTARVPLPLNLALLDPARPRVGVARDPSSPPRAAGGEVRGLPGPGYTYTYFWPDGTRFALTGERDGYYRIRLDENLDAWVSATEVRLLPEGTPPPQSTVEAVRLTPTSEWVDVRIPLDERLPFQVETDERALHVTLFGATSDTEWLQYGRLDPFVTRAEWRQPADGRYRLTLHLAEQPWGFRAFWSGDDLVVRVRRPPEIDPRRPLRGLLVALDPGHPPAGAVGPTRLTEPEANLAIALRLRDLLQDAGARVLMTRTTQEPLGLYERTRMATEADADVFISVHNNAFPDGVNPFENNGTSTYYFYGHSADLARSLQGALLRELRLRDLGIGRGDLAAVRHSWMPAALTETMFMMIPRQEAALRDPEVQERIARAHLRGLEDFLRRRAGRR